MFFFEKPETKQLSEKTNNIAGLDVVELYLQKITVRREL